MRRRTAASTSSSVRPSRLAVGSSRRSRGASRRKARARATRCRSPAESPAPSWPSMVSSPSGKPGHDLVETGVGDGRAHLVVGGVGSAEADVVGDGAGEQVGPLRDPGHLGPPRVGVEVGQIECPTATEPPEAGARPSRTLRRVDFPQPLGPAMATTSPGSTHRETSRQSRQRAAGVADLEPVDPERRGATGRAHRRRVPRVGTGRSSTSKTSSAAFIPSALAW